MTGKKTKVKLPKRNVMMRWFFIGLLALAFCIPVSAVVITESPDTINRGDQIHITIKDLPDNSEFSLLIEGAFSSEPGARFSFGTNNLNMPFTLTNGRTSATTINTDITGFTIKKTGGSTYRVAGSSSNGIYTTTMEGDISSGVYEIILFEGTALPDKNRIETQMNMRGLKTGPVDSQISFIVDGVDNGEVRITAIVNSVQALSKKVTIGSGMPVVSPTPTVSPTQTASPTPTVTNNYIGGTTDWPVPTTTAPTKVPAVSKTFYSADRTVSITVQGVDYIGLLSVDAKNIPEGWIKFGDAYTITPDNLTLSPAGDLTIRVPAKTGSGADYAYFIGKYQNGNWIIVPSTPADNVVKVKINGTGTYALMALKSESSTPPAGNTTPATVTSQSAVTTPGTPRIASIAQAAIDTTAPTDTPAKPAPLSIIPLIGAGLVCILIYKQSKQ